MPVKTLLTSLFLLSACISQAPAQSLSWVKSMGGGNNERAAGTCTAPDGSIYVTGSMIGSGDYDPGPGTFTLTPVASDDGFLVKLDSNGIFQWARLLGGTGFQNGVGVGTDANGNVYVAGEFSGTVNFGSGITLTTSGFAMFVVKFTPAGLPLWAGKADGLNSIEVFDMAVTTAGDIITHGRFQGNYDFDPGPGFQYLTNSNHVTNNNGFVCKWNTNGAYVWAGQFSNNPATGYMDYFPGQIRANSSNEVYVGGAFRYGIDFDPGTGTAPANATTDDAFLVKLNTNGTLAWYKQFEGTGDLDAILDITFDASGNLYLMALSSGSFDADPGPGITTISSAMAPRMLVIKLSAAGNFVWVKEFASTSTLNPVKIGFNSQQRLYLTGYFSGTMDMDPGPSTQSATVTGNQTFLVLLDSAGNHISSGSTALAPQVEPLDMVTLANDQVLVTGWYSGSPDFDLMASTFTGITASGVMDVFLAKWRLCPLGTPPAPLSTTSLNPICPGDSATLSASAIGTGTLQWFDSPSAGQQLGTGPTYSTGPLTATTTFYVEAIECLASPRTAITVTVLSASSSTLTQTACNSYTLNGQTYTSSGTYTQTLPNAAGCDSTITLNLNITILNALIFVNGGTLSTLGPNMTYQWFDCATGQFIPGATQQSFTPSQSGSYAVIVTSGPCVDTTGCQVVVGVEDPASAQWELFPNPASGAIQIRIPDEMRGQSFVLRDAAGRELQRFLIEQSQTRIDITGLPAGMYLVQPTQGRSRVFVKQ